MLPRPIVEHLHWLANIHAVLGIRGSGSKSWENSWNLHFKCLYNAIVKEGITMWIVK
jgi:hypothetical protein